MTVSELRIWWKDRPHNSEMLKIAAELCQVPIKDVAEILGYSEKVPRYKTETELRKRTRKNHKGAGMIMKTKILLLQGYKPNQIAQILDMSMWSTYGYIRLAQMGGEQNAHTLSKEYPYCNCGARMVGEENEK